MIQQDEKYLKLASRYLPLRLDSLHTHFYSRGWKFKRSGELFDEQAISWPCMSYAIHSVFRMVDTQST